MTEHAIENWLVIDYRSESTRTRKSEPNASELGKHEIVAPLRVDVVIPEPEVEPITARAEVPAPQLVETELDDVDADDIRDWQDVADDVLPEGPSVDAYISRIDAETLTFDHRTWRDKQADLVLTVLGSAPGRPPIDDVEEYLTDELRDRVDARIEDRHGGDE